MAQKTKSLRIILQRLKKYFEQKQNY